MDRYNNYDPRYEVEQKEDVKQSLTPDAERAAAEEVYTRRAFDYEQNPIGSRDWTLFWSGWCARAAQSAQPVSDAYKSEAQAVADDVVRDAERLDFLISEGASVMKYHLEGWPVHYWLRWEQDESEQCYSYPSPREAIDSAMKDAAMLAAQQQKDGGGA